MTIENIFLEELRRVISERPRGYQTEIANALKINTSTFSNMVCGRRGMDEDERRVVASYVGIDYESIVNRNPSSTNTSTIDTTMTGDGSSNQSTTGDNSPNLSAGRDLKYGHKYTSQAISGEAAQPQEPGFVNMSVSPDERDLILSIRKLDSPFIIGKIKEMLKKVEDIFM